MVIRRVICCDAIDRIMARKRTMVTDLEKNTKRKVMLRERDAYPLSDRKIVYAVSSGDGDPNFIVRATEDVNFKAFGVQGVRNVERAFFRNSFNVGGKS